ncbi:MULTISPECIES: hypothetical protein [unclassified Novosphingobium]|uniref:hypothetical protein n=1 Tax=unclassified Novosphingobium TaxID=2644732 RepID=UPI000D4CD040|nr:MULTISPECIES: hypothetical protein [unclassified Novosphingobium]PTR08678.1 hypothetical protein C8K11_111124 [Novosphingobium sp. GV055]PUB01401.1 hypothetical protein C8K12_111124 [Novosphingobium sp. GV061]PUB16975.1 hypothetical protein C8K14_111124 [Novosphingobium sp. GV079]PUB39998.1 hypothetical protein C8K10_111124 [Novosphingobium sp. GV027]
MADSVCPPLGTGSVDMNALSDAARKNKDLDAALAAATTRVEAPAQADPESDPAPTASQAVEQPAADASPAGSAQ